MHFLLSLACPDGEHRGPKPSHESDCKQISQAIVLLGKLYDNPALYLSTYKVYTTLNHSN